MDTLTVEPLTEITFGAVVTGIDLSLLDDKTWQMIETAFNEFGLLLFPGQYLDADTQVHFASRFGPIQGGAERATRITNRKEDRSILTAKDPTWLTLSYPTQYWHADGTFGRIPPKVCMLGAASVASEGGQTAYADMTAAYEALDDETRARIAGMSSYHSNLVGTTRVHTPENRAYLHELVGDQPVGGYYGLRMSVTCPLSPLVKVHPVTGRPALFLGRHTFGIPGLPLAESNTFIRELEDFACVPPRVYTHEREVGDLIVWDNRRLLHRACAYDDQSDTRELLNCRIVGDPNDAGLDNENAAKSAQVQRAELDRFLATTE